MECSYRSVADCSWLWSNRRTKLLTSSYENGVTCLVLWNMTVSHVFRCKSRVIGSDCVDLCFFGQGQGKESKWMILSSPLTFWWRRFRPSRFFSTTCKSKLRNVSLILKETFIYMKVTYLHSKRNLFFFKVEVWNCIWNVIHSSVDFRQIDPSSLTLGRREEWDESLSSRTSDDCSSAKTQTSVTLLKTTYETTNNKSPGK